MKEIEVILADIQKSVRYTGVELGLAAFRPGKPAETLARGYGDCKDKAALLVSRLRKAGIAANMVLLTPYPADDVSAEMPGMEGFTHAIAYVPGAHPLWIDATAEFAPARRLPWVDQGRLALIVDSHTTELVRTPVSDIREEDGIDFTVLQLSEEGKASLTLVREDQGGMEDIMRPFALQLLQVTPEKRIAAMAQILKPEGAEKVVDVDAGDPKDVSSKARMTVKGEGFANAGANEQSAYAMIPQKLTASPFLAALLQESARQDTDLVLSKRAEDFYLPHAFIQEDQWGVIAPAGFQLRQLPDVKDVPLGPLTLHRNVTTAPDGSLMLVSRLEVSKLRYTVAEAKSLSDALAKFNARPAMRVDFMPEGEMLMGAGKWKEGMTRLREDAESTPARVPPLLRYGAALLNAGLRDEAIAVFRKATVVDPKSANAYGYLASAYRHDPVGRLDKPGMDLAAAEASIQKAIELAPDDKKWAAERALLKEMDRFGARFEDPARLQEAIGLMEAMSADLPGVGRADLLPEALFMARRFSDVKSFYARVEGKNARKDLLIAALAAQESVAAALAEPQQVASSDEVRKNTLRLAARDLMLIGEYSKSAELYEAGLPPDDASTRLGVEMLRRARRSDEDRYSRDPVIAVVQQYIATLGERNTRDQYQELLTPEWRVLTYDTERSQLFGILTGFSRLGNQTLWARAISDIAIANADFMKDGDDATGYRVSFSDPSTNGTKRPIAWVVRRPEGYRILGLRNNQATAGGEALALTKRGDLAGARRWLDWEQELISPATGPDPLASEPFLKLWPPSRDLPEGDAILAAGASLTVRGLHYKDALPDLYEVRDRVPSGDSREVINHAIGDGLWLHREYSEETPLWRQLFASNPTSQIALNALGYSLAYCGLLDEALQLGRSIKADNLLPTATRIQARVYSMRHQFADTLQVYRDLCGASKCEATDWNTFAWVSLFPAADVSPSDAKPEIGAAETAVRTSQGRIPAYVHTLATLQAQTGKIKEAHDGLLRYLGTGDNINDSALFLQGSIAEALNLPQVAIGIYGKISKPEILIGDSDYELAQIRIARLRTAAH